MDSNTALGKVTLFQLGLMRLIRPLAMHANTPPYNLFQASADERF